MPVVRWLRLGAASAGIGVVIVAAPAGIAAADTESGGSPADRTTASSQTVGTQTSRIAHNDRGATGRAVTGPGPLGGNPAPHELLALSATSGRTTRWTPGVPATRRCGRPRTGSHARIDCQATNANARRHGPGESRTRCHHSTCDTRHCINHRSAHQPTRSDGRRCGPIKAGRRCDRPLLRRGCNQSRRTACQSLHRLVGGALLLVRPQSAVQLDHHLQPEWLRGQQNCSNTDLTGANLSGIDLSGIDFAHAQLAGTCFYGADLRDADLSGANLAGAPAQRRSTTGGSPGRCRFLRS